MAATSCVRFRSFDALAMLPSIMDEDVIDVEVSVDEKSYQMRLKAAGTWLAFRTGRARKPRAKALEATEKKRVLHLLLS